MPERSTDRLRRASSLPVVKILSPAAATPSPPLVSERPLARTPWNLIVCIREGGRPDGPKPGSAFRLGSPVEPVPA